MEGSDLTNSLKATIREMQEQSIKDRKEIETLKETVKLLITQKNNLSDQYIKLLSKHKPAILPENKTA